MFGLTALDVALGLITLFLTVALIGTAVVEYVAAKRGWRGDMLERAMAVMLSSDLARAFFADGRISRLSENGRTPSYVPSATAAAVIRDLVVEQDTDRPLSGDRENRADAGLTADVERIVRDWVVRQRVANPDRDESSEDTAFTVAEQTAAIEAWFNDTMDRASGWYKRRARGLLFLVCFTVCALMNVSATDAARFFSANPAAVESLLGEIDGLLPPPHDAGTRETPADAAGDGGAEETLALLGDQVAFLSTLPVGWQRVEWTGYAPGEDCTGLGCQAGYVLGDYLWSKGFWDVTLGLLIGWMLTALAASLGADFWVNALNRVMEVRATGRRIGTNGQQPQS
ncbi:MAG: hypothetical protein RLO50_04640 [Azospirillaceae bacterium]